MSERDDDDLEGDAQLKSMRAVWLSMRDEDPSDKGLAALMAAAREKADDLKKPKQSFWQAALAMFRRPPVLALASVAILLGGALVIANRGDKAMVDERAETTAQTRSAPAPDVSRPAAGSAALDSFDAGAATTAPVETPPEKTGAPIAEPPALPEPPKPRPTRTKPPERKEERKDDRDTGKKLESVAQPEPEPTAEAKIASDKPTEAPPPPVTRGPQMKPPTTQPSPGGVVGGAGLDSQMTDGESVAIDTTKTADEAEAGRAKSRVLQLVKQCESAAARGDCAAVKALAARIKTEDAATYKARVVKNTSIARCLE